MPLALEAQILNHWTPGKSSPHFLSGFFVFFDTELFWELVMGREAWHAVIHGVTKSDLSD